MPIRRVTPQSAIRQSIQSRVDRLTQAIVNNLIYVGESAVKLARDPSRRRYTDRTGNLTSSIGYAVLVNGSVVHLSGFPAKNGPAGNGSQGVKRGPDFLKQLIAEHSEGITFIMVAGMPYAVYVEDMGLDVLDSAELMAKDMLPRLMKKLKF